MNLGDELVAAVVLLVLLEVRAAIARHYPSLGRRGDDQHGYEHQRES